MATVAANPGEKSPHLPAEESYKPFEVQPWIDYAIQQSQILKATIQETADSVLETARSRLYEIHSTSSAHLHQTLDSLETLKLEFDAYENLFFGKLKEGLIVAASHPAITCGVAAGLGTVVLKNPTFDLLLASSTIYMITSDSTSSSPYEHPYISQFKACNRWVPPAADTRVKALREAIEKIKFEVKVLEASIFSMIVPSLIHEGFGLCLVDCFFTTLLIFEMPFDLVAVHWGVSMLTDDYEGLRLMVISVFAEGVERELQFYFGNSERASRAEDEMERGKTKLRHAGRQIQSVIHSSYKSERQARGLKDALGELPRREASKFRSQVSSLASVAKQERSALSKEDDMPEGDVEKSPIDNKNLEKAQKSAIFGQV
ncbi:hypothetical protein ACLOJK_005594 [Asimina triloba]